MLSLITNIKIHFFILLLNRQCFHRKITIRSLLLLTHLITKSYLLIIIQKINSPVDCFLTTIIKRTKELVPSSTKYYILTCKWHVNKQQTVARPQSLVTQHLYLKQHCTDFSKRELHIWPTTKPKSDDGATRIKMLFNKRHQLSGK